MNGVPWMSNEYSLPTLNELGRLNEDYCEVCNFLVSFLTGVDYYNNNHPDDIKLNQKLRNALEEVVTIYIVDYFLNDPNHSHYYQFKDYIRYTYPVCKWTDYALTHKVLDAIKTLSYSEDGLKYKLEALRKLDETIKSSYNTIELVKIMKGGKYGTQETCQ